MGFTGKANSSSGEQQQNPGMGFLFVFVPKDQQENNNSSSSSSNKKKNNPPFGHLPSFKRTNSSHILSRAQSTISICALLIFVTLLLFALSTFEPSSANNVKYSSHLVSRRQLITGFSPPGYLMNGNNYIKQNGFKSFPAPSRALQGMGTLYRRGTKSMNDLVVAHVVESMNLHDLKFFLRLFFGSALNSRADLLFIFSTKSAASDNIILEENDLLLKLVGEYKKLSSTDNSMISSRKLEVPQFIKWSKNDKRIGEPIWGARIRSNSSGGGNETESTRLSYGSVVGFDADELDPENSLAGFLDHVPMSLRRWACYPMLLGRVRRNFKHIMLVDVKEVLLMGDPMSRIRSSSPESIHLSTVTQSTTTRHGKKSWEKTQSSHTKSVNPAIIRGGARGVRRLSHAMLNEIVRAASQKKKKNSVTELGIFNQLVGNEFLLKNVKLITSTESIPELSSLAGSNSKPGTSSLVRRGNNNFDVNSGVFKNILCSSPLQNSVYSNCL